MLATSGPRKAEVLDPRAMCVMRALLSWSPHLCWEQGQHAGLDLAAKTALKVLPDLLPKVWVQESRDRQQSNQGFNQSTFELLDALRGARGPAVLRSGACLPQFPHLCSGELLWLYLVFKVILRIKKRLSHL